MTGAPALAAVLGFAALAGTASAQILLQPVQPAQPRIEVRGVAGARVQSATPGISCAGPDLVECAQTDPQRRMLLMSYTSRQLTDEQVLRLIADLQDVNAPNESGRQTLLTAMIAAGRLKAVAALLDKGADPMAADRAGGLLLNRAIEDAFASAFTLRPEVLVCLRAALEALLGQLSQAGSKLDPAMLAKLGWTYAKRTGASGTEEHFFSLIAIGHGLFSAPTLALVPRGARQAIVVQADTMNLCEHFGLKTQTALCGDTRQALTDIARRLEARFAD